MYRASWDLCEEDVALKCMHTSDGQRTARFLQEIRRHASLNHPNVVRYYGVTFAPAPSDEAKHIPFCVMELCAAGSLWRLLQSSRALSWLDRIDIALGCACGMQYLHDYAKMAHLDLKSLNILLSEQGSAKIAGKC